MTRLHSISLFSALALTTTVLGCGDDNDRVSGGVKLSSLSDAEAKSLCKESARTNAKLLEQGCSFQGLYFSEEEGSCEMVRDACIEAGQDACEGEALQDDFVDCDATVDDLRQCQRDQAQAFETALAEISCESSLEKYEEAFDATEPSASCLALFDKCPSLVLEEDEALASRGLRRFAPRTRR